LVRPWLWGSPAAPAEPDAPQTALAPAAPAVTPPHPVGSEPRVGAPASAAAPRRAESAAIAPQPEPSEEVADDVEVFPPADEPPPPDPAEEAKAPYFPQPVPYTGPTGIELFPPMGTKQAREGLIVPEDFPLPEGYVRHHQVSEDGQLLPAILMVHPDYQIFDETGAVVADRNNPVVPPEYAPEGLPIQMLELPEAEE
jgi:hypothetical protein